MVDELPVRAGGGVVELVDDDVVEGVRTEVSEVGFFSESLDRGEEDVRTRVFLRTCVEAEGGFGSDPAECIEGLAQNLLAVGDEEYAFGAEAVGVECGEPGLSESGGEHDESGGVSFGAGLFEGFEGFLLDRVGPGDGAWGLGRDAHGSLSFGGAAGTIARDPIRCQRGCLGMREQALELPDDGFESGVLSPVVAGGDDAVVPLDGVGECRVAEVRASDVGDAFAKVWEISVKDIGLGVEALASGLEDADVQDAFGALLQIE